MPVSQGLTLQPEGSHTTFSVSLGVGTVTCTSHRATEQPQALSTEWFTGSIHEVQSASSHGSERFGFQLWRRSWGDLRNTLHITVFCTCVCMWCKHMSVQRRVPMCAHAEVREGLWVSSSSALVFTALRYSLPSNLTPTLSARTDWAVNSLCRKSTCLYILYCRGSGQIELCPAFYLRARVSNVGPHVCGARFLTH